MIYIYIHSGHVDRFNISSLNYPPDPMNNVCYAGRRTDFRDKNRELFSGELFSGELFLDQSFDEMHLKRANIFEECFQVDDGVSGR